MKKQDSILKKIDKIGSEMTTRIKVNKGNKLIQIITKTPLEGVKNRKSKQYYTSKTTYVKKT